MNKNQEVDYLLGILTGRLSALEITIKNILSQRSDGLTEKQVIELIEKVLKEKLLAPNAVQELIEEESDLEEQKQAIFKKLTKAGFDPSKNGFKYLVEAALYIKNSDEDLTMTKHVYPYVASVFKEKDTRVERSMRYAIEERWARKAPKERKPTVSRFLYTIAGL